MSLKSLRKRLDRLTPPPRYVIGQDIHSDRRRRGELKFRKATGESMSARDIADLAALDAAFEVEDRDRKRHGKLFLRTLDDHQEPLTDAEREEMAEIARRYPPDPNYVNPLKDIMEEMRQTRRSQSTKDK
jgi:hypothetical protein